jgi:hypothetical protein
MRRSWLLSLVVGLVAAAAVAAVGLTWNDQAEKICRDNAPAGAGGYAVRWEWEEFAYVCDYVAPEAEQRRVGIIDAFHGDRGRRHGR